jgi:polyhydroxybutyrate depolymerase
MATLIFLLGLQLTTWSAGPEKLAPGDDARILEIDGRKRSYLVHVPPSYNATSPAPVVLIFHGAGMNAKLMLEFSGVNAKADEAGFVAVYPNGTGAGPFLTFNSGGIAWDVVKQQPNDVAFVARLLDDLATVVNVDPRRVYATGMSNGGMMCYRLAAELSDRIAAIAPVAGTMAATAAEPKRPVPVLHLHGTEDRLVPFGGPDQRVPKFLSFKSVEDTVATWVQRNGCHDEPLVEELPDLADDGTTVTRETYRGDNGAEVVLVVVHGGGHTWPGRQPPFGMLGRSTRDIYATDLIWEFLSRHRLP